MKCEKCRKDLFDGAQFCKYCGTPVILESANSENDSDRSQQVSSYCWKCGKALATGAEFCRHCGSPVKKLDAEYKDTAESVVVEQTSDDSILYSADKSIVKIILITLIAALVAIALVVIGVFVWFHFRKNKTDDREKYSVASEEALDVEKESESSSKSDKEDKVVKKESEEEQTEESTAEEKAEKNAYGFIEQYNKIIDSYETEHSSNENSPSYDLILFDNDDTPELVAGLDGYYVSMYSYDKDKDAVHCVIEDWPYGAMGNAGYDYIPRANIIRNYNSDYAGMIRYTTFSRMNASYEIENVAALETDYYEDRDGDGEPSWDGEEYTEEAQRYVDVLTNKEISAESYNSMMRYGKFETIVGQYVAGEMKERMESFPENDEYADIKGYEIFIEDCTWEEAFDKCLEKGGHLACFESPDEWRDMLETLKIEGLTNTSLFIAGRRDSNSEQYRWINADGKPGDDIINSSTYKAFWLDGEPSFEDDSIEECYMDVLYKKKADSWFFNDIPNDVIAVAESFSGKIGYICEYDAPSEVSEL